MRVHLIRSLVRRPGLSLMIVMMLAMAIAANTAIYSIDKPSFSRRSRSASRSVWFAICHYAVGLRSLLFPVSSWRRLFESLRLRSAILSPLRISRWRLYARPPPLTRPAPGVDNHDKVAHLTGKAVTWIGSYEQWVLDRFGMVYRRNTLRNWYEPSVLPERMRDQWLRFGRLFRRSRKRMSCLLAPMPHRHSVDLGNRRRIPGNPAAEAARRAVAHISPIL